MAKITAHGAVKLMEASRDVATDSNGTFGPITRYHYVLCSDGRVLRSFSFPQAGNAYDRKRSSYSVLRAWSGLSRGELLTRFAAWAGQKGLVLS